MSETDIIDLYNKGMGIETIAKKYSVGKLKIRDILLKNNITIKNRGGVKKYTYEYNNNIKENDKKYIAVCKISGKHIKDYNNKSGAISKHLQTLNIPILDSLDGIRFYKKNGFEWYQQYIDIILKPEIKHKEKKVKKIYNSTIKCEICNSYFNIITNTHLKKHNLTQEEYKIKYPGVKLVNEDLENIYRNKMIDINKTNEKSFESKAEKNIKEYIKSLGFKVESKNKKLFNGVEIDLFLPELNIAFEYNGLYYHTEKNKKNRFAHINKTNLCLSKGINLYQIFEDEWETKNNIVLHKINNLLNLTSKKIYARNCYINEISFKEAKNFLDINHLQGSSKSTTYLGLFDSKELVGVMSFKNINGSEYELSRYATKLGVNVIGGASKLLKKYITSYKPTKIISFADIRWTPDYGNNLYTKLNFTLVSILKPDYKYYNSSVSKYRRFHKFGFRKKILLNKYKNFMINDSMTEKEMSNILGYERIWDCGLYKYELII